MSLTKTEELKEILKEKMLKIEVTHLAAIFRDIYSILKDLLLLFMFQLIVT